MAVLNDIFIEFLTTLEPGRPINSGAAIRQFNNNPTNIKEIFEENFKEGAFPIHTTLIANGVVACKIGAIIQGTPDPGTGEVFLYRAIVDGANPLDLANPLIWQPFLAIRGDEIELLTTAKITNLTAGEGPNDAINYAQTQPILVATNLLSDWGAVDAQVPFLLERGGMYKIIIERVAASSFPTVLDIFIFAFQNLFVLPSSYTPAAIGTGWVTGTGDRYPPNSIEFAVRTDTPAPTITVDLELIYFFNGSGDPLSNFRTRMFKVNGLPIQSFT